MDTNAVSALAGVFSAETNKRREQVNTFRNENIKGLIFVVAAAAAAVGIDSFICDMNYEP